MEVYAMCECVCDVKGRKRTEGRQERFETLNG